VARRQAQVEVTLRDRASSGLRRLGGVANGLARAFGLVTAAATAITTVVGARFLRGGIQSVGDFSEAMSRVQAVTGAAGEELKALRDAADEAGTTTRFTATEAAEGLEELARAGLNANQSIEALIPSLDLAAGNNQSVAESALQITTALNAFGLAAEDAGRVADVYTRAAQRSAQTTGQLGEAMTFVAPVARAAGIEIEETAALVGRLADAGFRGSMGGTALRNAILQFQDPASAFRRELSAIGIEAEDFGDALFQLAEAGEDGEAAIRSLGLRAGPAIQALVSGGAPAIQELTRELQNADGAAGDAAATMAQNLPGAIRSLNSAWDSLRRRVAEPLVEGITGQVEGLTEKIREFVASGQVEQFGELLRDIFETAANAVREFVSGINFDEVRERIESFVESSRSRISDFNESVSGLRSGFERTVGAINLLVGGLRLAFNVLGTVISGLVTVSVGALEGLFQVLDRTSFGLSRFVSTAADELNLLRRSAQETTAGFAAAVGESLDQMGRGWDQLAQTTESANDRTAASFDRAGEAIQSSEEYLESLKDALREAGVNVDDVGEKARDMGGEAEEAGEKLEEAASGSVTGWVDLGDGLEKVTVQLGEVAEAADGAGERSSESMGGARDELERMGSPPRRATESVDDLGDATTRAGGAADSVAAIIADTLGSLRQISDGARQSVDDWVNSLPQLQSIEGFFRRLSEFSARLTQQYNEQVQTSERWIKQIEAGNRETLRLAEAALDASESLALLDQANLDGLRAAASAARAELTAMREEAEAGVQRLEDELLRLQGRTDELEERRRQRQRDEIELQLQKQNLDRDTENALREQLRILDQISVERDRQAEAEGRSAEDEERRLGSMRAGADAMERQADAAERAGRAPTPRSAAHQIEIRGIVERGEVEFSEAQMNRITERVLRVIRTDLQRG
jgi:TP901 family phage tail tape measure protein